MAAFTYGQFSVVVMPITGGCIAVSYWRDGSPDMNLIHMHGSWQTEAEAFDLGLTAAVREIDARGHAAPGNRLIGANDSTLPSPNWTTTS